MSHHPRSILFMALSCATLTINAQTPMDRGHGTRAWKEAISLLQQKDTTGAIELLATVNRNDSIYEKVLLGRVDLLIEKNALAQADALAVKGMKLGSGMSGQFAVKHAALLFDLERFDECIAATDSIIAQRPGLFRPRHLKALALAGKGDKQGCLQLLMQNARDFPYNREPHLLLSNIAAEEGHVALSAMAGAMAQIVRYDDDVALALLTYQDALLNGRIEKKPAGYDLGITSDDDTELDQLIASRIAMDKKYKVQPDLDFPICRQSHLLFSQVADGHAKGFFHEFYGPLITEIMKGDLFEGYVLHCLSSSDNKKVKSISDRGRAKVVEFRDRISKIMDKHYAVHPDGGTGALSYHSYDNDGNLSGRGGADAEATVRQKEWTFFHSNGMPSSKGDYSDDGKEMGLWQNWFDNGEPRAHGMYSNGELDGVVVNYYINGEPMDSAVVRKGVKEGPYVGFNHMGGVSWRKTMTNDISDGPVLEFHPDGSTKWSYSHKNGKVHGAVRQTDPDGSLRTEGTYAEDKRIGTYTTYHPNGTKSEEFMYDAGVGQGPWKEWYANGSLRYEGTLTQDKNTGEQRSYDEWGSLVQVEHFDMQGRMDGVRQEFTNDGILRFESEFSRDLMVKYTYYDRKGAVLGTAKRAQGKFDLTGYHVDGAPRVQGTYLDEGVKDGVWRYLYPDGTTEMVENYKNGKAEGEQLTYDGTGILVVKEVAYEHDGVPYLQHIRYHPSGAVHETGQMKGGSYEGEYRRMGPDGRTWALEYYVDGDREGWQEYFDMDGKAWYSERLLGGLVAERVNYDTSGTIIEHILIRPGAFEFINHYPGGAVASSHTILNGEHHGTSKWFYPDGTLEWEGSFRCGTREGPWASYHPNGKKQQEHNYVKGKLNGIAREFYPDGVKESEYEYAHGELNGRVNEYHRNGERASTAIYSNGVRHGALVNYGKDGLPLMARFYHKGDLVAYGMPAADGSVKDTIKVGVGVISLRTEFRPGVPARVMNYRNGLLHGEFKEYGTNERVVREGQYKGDEIDGAITEYHPSGTVRSVHHYSEGLRHGEDVINRSNGTVEERITYRYGMKHGPWILYDEQGRPKVTMIMRNNDVIAITK